MKSKILALLVLVTLFSCKEEPKSDAVAAPVEEAPKDFEVKINVVAKKDDSFHLFYTEDGTINFTEQKSVWVEFKGNEAAQDIVFKLPEDVIPTHMRLDFGVNKQQEDIKMNSFEIDYMNGKIVANGAEFFSYFYPNEKCTKIDAEKSLIIPIKGGDVYTGPMFYPQVVLSEKIEALVKGK
ncbi:hypothetical protein HUK80_04460 [Flavobacterium sp. MAH-1]|uniref:Uncharacterized protein n=1 Tax=Flavobacterium agri TaxID=2743471 RepID=A0A7Y8Y0K5_9FLAO|nr:hypothetical protein [Flavobacterium agri]NUY80137.1 hypothetical protein [Flavobacterium agri]NYA70162.1 hypothetical protein [Flavobacterium agri]